MKNILVTGAFGQIGSELVPALQKKKGVAKVVAHDKRQPPAGFPGIIELADITDAAAMENIVKKYKIDTVFHLVSLLSATGEQNPNLAWDINMNGLKIILDLAVKYKMRVFWPSSIAAFGPTTPRDKTPQQTVLEPTTMYGATKVAGELLCQYYHLKYGLDVRSVRYPGLISWKTPPGGGTTDYAVAIFYDALAKGSYDCFVKKDTVLPMMYMDDAIRGTIKLMDAPESKIKIHTSYNMAAISFRADELAREINKHIPVKTTYHPDRRQKIADSWPRTIDDRQARKDWGWKHDFDLAKMTKVMLTNLKKHAPINISEIFQNGELFVVAHQSQREIGMVSAKEISKGRWEIVSTFVAPEMRGHGLAEKLMNEIITKIQAKTGASSISLTVNASAKPAVTLYQKLGFVISKTVAKKYVMEKIL